MHVKVVRIDRFLSCVYIAVWLPRYLAASCYTHNTTPVLCAPSRTSARTCVTKWNRALIIMQRARMLCSLMYVATVNIPHTVYPKPHVNGCIVKTSGHGFLQDSLPTRPRDLFSSWKVFVQWKLTPIPRPIANFQDALKVRKVTHTSHWCRYFRQVLQDCRVRERHALSYDCIDSWSPFINRYQCISANKVLSKTAI